MKKFYFESIILYIIFTISGYSSAIAQTYGDVNGDGLINSDDIRLVLHNSIGPGDRIMELTPEQIPLADVDGDGQITPYDAGLILKRSLASSFIFPVEGNSNIMSSAIAATPISISIPTVEGAPGSEVLAPIITGDVGGSEIIAITITLECDKDILTPLGIVSIGTLTEHWCSDFPDNCYYEVNVRKDRIYIGMIGLGISGGGTLVKVKYKVSDFVNPGNESPLNFLDFQYNLGDPPTATTNGKFKAILPSSYILITSPNGGEKIKGGAPYDITWNKVGSGINRLQLLYSVDSGISFNNIVLNTENDGIYTWNPVPTVNTSIALIKAIGKDINNVVIMADVSNGFFTIDSTKPETTPVLTGIKGENNWWNSNVTVELSSTDNLSGVKEINYKINEGQWLIYSSPFLVTGSTIYYYAEDRAGNKETEKSLEIKIDKTPPETPIVTDEGDCTTNGSRLSASWTTSEDPESNVVEYRYAIGTAPDKYDVVGWTSVGNNTQVTKTGLNLVNGRDYYFSVQAKNGAGLWSDTGKSNGITYYLPEIVANPENLTFYALIGAGNPSPQKLSISNPGCGTLNWAIGKDKTWITCDPLSGQCDDEIDDVTVSVDISGLSEGEHSATLRIVASEASNSPKLIPVTLKIYSFTEIKINSPNSGEKIKGGSSYNITWSSSKVGIDHVHLQYTINGTEYADITGNTPDDGSYIWDVPALNSGTVKIKIMAKDASNNEKASDLSDGFFMIDSMPPTTNATTTGNKGENNWWISNVTIGLSSSDNLSGVKEIKYKINTGNWLTYSAPFVVSGSTIYYYAEDIVGNKESEKSLEVKIDKTNPSTPVVTDDGICTSDGSQLHASWTASNDSESGITEYQYAIGKSPGGIDVLGWTSAGNSLQVTKTGLNLVEDQIYYFSVKAKNGAGLWSDIGQSDGIKYQLPEIGFIPSSFTFYALTNGINPSPQVLKIANIGCGNLNWSVSKDKNWLSFNPLSGQSSGETDEVTVSVNTAGLSSGTHSAIITINASGASNSPKTIPVTLNLSDTPSIKIVHPNGDEKIMGGSIYNITWTSSGGIHHIHIQYSTNGGSTYKDIITNTADDGLYEWNPVPKENSSTVKVKLLAKDAGNNVLAWDESDKNFVIDSTPPETIINLAGVEVSGIWYSDVMVSLSASDISGVKQTIYKINNEPWNTYTGPFVVTGSYIYYKSEDNVGNLEDIKVQEVKINKNTQPEGVYKRNLNLYPGPNLVSICVDIGYDHLPSVLYQISGHYEAVWAYDAVQKVWKRYIPGDPSSDLNTIEPGKGYCIIMKDKATISFIGRIINTPIHLTQGWNFVGYNSINTKANSLALSSIKSYYKYATTYNNPAKTWLKHIPQDLNIFNSLDYFYPNQGYWIYVIQDCDWSLSP